MKPLIAIVDYEMGNLHSVSKAIEKSGGRVQVTSSPSRLESASAVVLPGVGAFGEAVKRLRTLHLIKPIINALSKQKPFLGICLGLQLLFDRSEECRSERGLGFIPGRVVRFHSSQKKNLKIPHMGWNTIAQNAKNKTPILRGVQKNSYFYFVHSFFPVPEDPSLIATQTFYGKSFCSAVARQNLFASQFHPEKSGDNGLALLRNFVQEVSLCS